MCVGDIWKNAAQGTVFYQMVKATLFQKIKVDQKFDRHPQSSMQQNR